MLLNGIASPTTTAFSTLLTVKDPRAAIVVTALNPFIEKNYVPKKKQRYGLGVITWRNVTKHECRLKMKRAFVIIYVILFMYNSNTAQGTFTCESQSTDFTFCTALNYTVPASLNTLEKVIERERERERER